MKGEVLGAHGWQGDEGGEGEEGGGEGEEGGDVGEVEDDGTGEEGVLTGSIVLTIAKANLLASNEGVSVNLRRFLICCLVSLP